MSRFIYYIYCILIFFLLIQSGCSIFQLSHSNPVDPLYNGSSATSSESSSSSSSSSSIYGFIVLSDYHFGN